MPQPLHDPQPGIRRFEVAAGEPRQAPFPDGPVVRVVVAAGEGGPMGVLEVTMPAGCVMPEHEHGASAVLLAPLTGRFRLVEGGTAAVVEVEPGAVATIPPGARVRLENGGHSEARTLVVLSPPDFAGRIGNWPPVAAAIGR